METVKTIKRKALSMQIELNFKKAALIFHLHLRFKRSPKAIKKIPNKLAIDTFSRSQSGRKKQTQMITQWLSYLVDFVFFFFILKVASRKSP